MKIFVVLVALFALSSAQDLHDPEGIAEKFRCIVDLTKDVFDQATQRVQTCLNDMRVMHQNCKELQELQDMLERMGNVKNEIFACVEKRDFEGILKSSVTFVTELLECLSQLMDAVAAQVGPVARDIVQKTYNDLQQLPAYIMSNGLTCMWK